MKKWKASSPTDVINKFGMRTDRDCVQGPITMNDLKLLVQQEAGDEVEEDISCDSTFMLEKIPEILEALSAAFHWVPRDKAIYLFMDNAGGHGTNDSTAPIHWHSLVSIGSNDHTKILLTESPASSSFTFTFSFPFCPHFSNNSLNSTEARLYGS